MQRRILTKLALFPACLVLVPFVALTVVVATPAVAQQREADGDNDRGNSEERRRGSWGSWRRDRNERRDESSDRDRDRDAEPASDSRQSDDSPAMTSETYAKGLVDKLDKNENKVLDGEELTSLTGPARTADFNKDGFITREEIVASLATPSSKSPPPASASETSTAAKESPAQPSENNNEANASESAGRDRDRGFSRFGRGDRGRSADALRAENAAKGAMSSKRVLTWTGGAKPGEDQKTSRRTYRFTPARERMPTELPSWFKSQDKNGDGQVAMSEYSRSWNKSTVAKFQGYDTNGDGIVTAKEVAGKQ